MQFTLSDEQLMLQALVERFLKDRYPPGKRASYRAAPSGYSSSNWAQLADLGVFAAPFPAEHGGLGAGPMESIVVMEALGRGLAAEPVLEQIVLPGRLILHSGSAAQRRRWLPQIMAGERHLSVAHIEQAESFDLTHVNAVVQSGAAGMQISGEKTMVPGSGGADEFIVSAREPGRADDPDAIGFYLVRADAPGVEARPFRLVDGSVACQLSLHGASVTEKLDCDFRAFAQAVDDARIAACAEMIGIMSVLLEATLDYVRNRKQFGAALGSFQVIQHRLADLYVLLEQSRSHLYRAVLSAHKPHGGAAAVAGMKSYISAAAVQMGEQCIHLHGGMGTTDELAIGHCHKRLLVLATMFGDADSELQRFTRLSA
ncbi:MAG: acyl-CoA dehydrogenase [Steroidobacteraceae bacterium]|nr:acyl-CoA dehydrogenase [Steroidobacteraceae bacterium]